jgi:hypothetical protein
MRIILWASMIVAAASVVVSFILHLRSLFGIGLSVRLWLAMHLAIFVLAIPMSIFIHSRTKGYSLWDRRRNKAIYGGCPSWMMTGIRAVFAYFLLVMAIFFVKIRVGNDTSRITGPVVPIPVAVFFSAGWLSVYSVLFAMFYSGIRTVRPTTKCPNGHGVSPGSGYCEECGALISDTKHKS